MWTWRCWTEEAPEWSLGEPHISFCPLRCGQKQEITHLGFKPVKCCGRKSHTVVEVECSTEIKLNKTFFFGGGELRCNVEAYEQHLKASWARSWQQGRAVVVATALPRPRILRLWAPGWAGAGRRWGDDEWEWPRKHGGEEAGRRKHVETRHTSAQLQLQGASAASWRSLTAGELHCSDTHRLDSPGPPHPLRFWTKGLTPMLSVWRMEEFVTEEEEPWYDQQDLEQGKPRHNIRPPACEPQHPHGVSCMRRPVSWPCTQQRPSVPGGRGEERDRAGASLSSVPLRSLPQWCSGFLCAGDACLTTMHWQHAKLGLASQRHVSTRRILVVSGSKPRLQSMDHVFKKVKFSVLLWCEY